MSSEEAITKPNPDEDAAPGERPPRPSPSQEELAAMDANDAKAILDAAKKAAVEDSSAEEEQGQQEYDLEAAPLHLGHTLREPALLRGNPGYSNRARSRSGSRSRTSSRDASPSPMTHLSSTGGEAHHRRKSSSAGLGTPAESIPGSAAPTVAATTASSVSGSNASDAGSDIDPDILLDRLGFDSDLEPPSPHEVAKGELASGSTWGHSSQPLPSLNERMTEDSLEDAGAFADLVSTLHTSLRAHALGEEIAALGILDEVGEEADDEGGSSDDDDEDEEGKGVGGGNGNGSGGESEGRFRLGMIIFYELFCLASVCFSVETLMPSHL